MAQIDLPTLSGSRRSTRTYDFQNDPARILNAVAELLCPTGTIIPILSGQEPGEGWKLCNGQQLSKGDFPRLFSVIGNAFGETEGTFGLPDLRGRVPIGANGSASLSPFSFGGSASLTLSEDQMPQHSHAVNDPGHTHAFSPTPHGHAVTDPGHAHTITDPGHTHTAAELVADFVEAGITAAGVVAGDTGGAATGISVDSASTGVSVQDASAGGAIGAEQTGLTLGTAGGGLPIAILPPYLAVYWMVRT